MNSISEPSEGLSMDSSVFSDDDFLDWRWPASFPRRCDREGAGTLRMDYAMSLDASTHTRSNSSSSIEELFFYCTEELGSESTSGVADICTSPSIDATTSGRSAYEEYNWALKHQACVSSSGISSDVHMFEANAAHHHHHHCHAASGGSGRRFPPPLASLLSDRPLMRSFKSDGRFILKKVTNASRSLFQSTRKNGCLRLDLLSSSFDCLESQHALVFFPASSPHSEDVALESTPTIHYDHDSESSPLFHWLGISSPHSILHPKPTPHYKTMCPPFKLQAFGMSMHSKGPHSPLGEDATSFQASHLIEAQAQARMAMAASTPHVFALLKLLPSGLSLIIFEIRTSKSGDCITLHGMYILKNFGFLCSSRATMSSCNHHCLSNSYGIISEEPKGKLFPFEDCRK